MEKFRRVLRITGILLTVLILTVFLSNKFGNRIVSFETKLYQKATGKSPQHFIFDSTGVPIIVYQGSLGKQYNAVTVAEQALKYSGLNDTSARKSFFNCIKWLTDNFTILNDSSILFNDFYNWPSYQMTSPWRSAMNQGRAMQAFIKAFEMTGDSAYLEYARKSMNSLYTEVKNGGLTYIDSSGYWYEEYADDNVPQSRVLNGMIVVLQALSDFYKVDKDTGAYFLLNQGVKAVKNNLYLYNNKGHSNYDIFGKPASSWYHRFHIEQLGYLYTETGDPIFNEYRQKWIEYKEPSYLTCLFRKPTNIGLFAVFTIFISVLSVISFLSYFFLFIRKAH